MQKLKLSMVLAMFFLAINANAQSQDEKAIHRVITSFSKAGDNNADEEMDLYLDENYRVVMNRFFGSTDVAVMPKSAYLKKIRSKEFGGDTRELTFEKILINGSTATAKVIFEGKKMKVASLITLVRDENQNWKLVSDIPNIL